MGILSKLGGAFNWIENIEDPQLPPGEWLLRSEKSEHTSEFIPDVHGRLFLTNHRLIFRRSVERWKVSIPKMSMWRTLTLNLHEVFEVSTPTPKSRWKGIWRRGKKVVLLEVAMVSGDRHRFWVADPQAWAESVETASAPYRRGSPGSWRGTSP